MRPPARGGGALWLGAALMLAAALPAAAGQAVWTPVGPYGGTVGALAVAPGGGTIYAGTASSGLFRSADGGATWQALPKGPGGGEVMALSLVASQPSTLHVAVNGFSWRSDDGGNSWVRTAFPHSSSALVAAAPSSAQVVYGSDGFGVFASGDGGASVHQVTNVSSLFVLIRELAVSPLAAMEVYAVTDHGLFKTPDGGATWAQLPVGGIPVTLAIDARDPATLYAGTADGAFFASHDRGATWAKLGTGLGAGSIDAIAADPVTGGTLYAGVNGSSASGVWKSADGGASWALAVATPKVDALAASPAAGGKIVAGLEPAGVLKSEDSGATWALSNQGLSGTVVSAAVADPFAAGTLYAVVYSHNQHNFDVTGIDDQALPLGLQRSRDGGATWERADSGLDVTGITRLLADPNRRGFLYAVANPRLYVSADGADSWRPAAGDPGVLELFDIALDPKRPGTLYLAGVRLVVGKPVYVAERSTDSGATWTNLSLAGTASPTLDAVAVDPFLPAHVYFGGSGLLRSVRRGNGLARIGSGLPANFLLYKLLPDPDVPGRFYALMFSGVPSYAFFRSLDAGATWTRSRAGLPPQRFQLFDLTADAAASTLFASSPLGVFASRDGGAHWQPASAGLLGAAGGLLLDDPLDAGTILTASELGGLWTYTAAR